MTALLFASSQVGAQQASDVVQHVAKKQGDKVIGKLKWEIVETATSEVLAKGDKKILLKDVTVEVQPANELAPEVHGKRIKLGNQFFMRLPEFGRKPEEGYGFAITGDRDDMDTFSWDWFNTDWQNHATKLQETGELSVTVEQIDDRWEVTRMEFLTDVSIRVDTYEALKQAAEGSFEDLIAKSANPTWRIKIFKGSVIYWPSLVNGEVVDNGSIKG